MRHAAAFAGEPARLFDIHPATSAVSARQDAYIRAREFDRPTVIFDLDMLRGKYRALEAGLGDATIHYAVKANPAPEVVAALAALGGRFDCASRGEIDLCLGLGVSADRIAFGNTIKRAADIAHAHAHGRGAVRRRRRGGARKIAEHAPGARVVIRMLVEASEADWPLSRKFGCSRREALRLMDLGRFLGLDVAGISFHPGPPDARAARCGRARSTRRTRSGPRRPRPATSCASSTSAAASRPSTASRCRRPRTMPRR